MTDKYDDIIDLPCPTSSKHPRMSSLSRAAQFSPFAALTGHDAAIEETARMTDRKIDLSEDAKEVLDEKISFLLNVIEAAPEITVTHFVRDKRKTGGAYVACTGRLRLIDGIKRKLFFTDSTEIAIDNVYDIDCELFEDNL